MPEAFFATLTVKRRPQPVWLTRAARLAIFAIDSRRHSTLAYATPAEHDILAQGLTIAYPSPVHTTEARPVS